jgi:DNA-binding phage protein
MPETYIRPFGDIFLGVPDHRRRQGRRHALPTVLIVVVLGLINQQNSLRQIARWAGSLDHSMRRRLRFRHGKAPSYNTIRRVLLGLDVDALGVQLQQWVEETVMVLAGSRILQGLAIDGKTVRGSSDEAEGTPALQVLHAMVHGLGAIVRSQLVPIGTNETKAIHRMLEDLVLKGRVVTLDAAFTHRDVAEVVLEKGGTT